MNKLILIIFIFLIILFIGYYFLKRESIIYKNPLKYNLQDDGFVYLPKLLDNKSIVNIKNLVKKDNYEEVQSYVLSNHSLKSRIFKQLGEGYTFQNYMLIIKKSSIHTCHRDSNGSFFNPDLNNKTYTLIIFLEPMKRSLGLIPQSHLSPNHSYINIQNNVISFTSSPGDALLFNSDLLHVGEINDKPDNLRLQFKLCHYSDVNKLDYYNNYFKVLNQNNNYPDWVRKIQKHISCLAPGFSNLAQSQIQNDSESDSVSYLNRMFSKLLYGNADFYNLDSIKMN